MARGRNMRVRATKEKKKVGIARLFCAICFVFAFMILIVLFLYGEFQKSYYPTLLTHAEGLFLPESKAYKLDTLEHIAQNLYDNSHGQYEIFPCDGNVTYATDGVLLTKVLPSVGNESSYIFIEESSGNVEKDLQAIAKDLCNLVGEPVASFQVKKDGEGLLNGARSFYQSGKLTLESFLVSKTLYVTACNVQLSDTESVSFFYVTEKLAVLKECEAFMKEFLHVAVIKTDEVSAACEKVGEVEGREGGNYESTSPYAVREVVATESTDKNIVEAEQEELEVITSFEILPVTDNTDTISDNTVIE